MLTIMASSPHLAMMVSSSHMVIHMIGKRPEHHSVSENNFLLPMISTDLWKCQIIDALDIGSDE